MIMYRIGNSPNSELYLQVHICILKFDPSVRSLRQDPPGMNSACNNTCRFSIRNTRCWKEQQDNHADTCNYFLNHNLILSTMINATIVAEKRKQVNPPTIYTDHLNVSIGLSDLLRILFTGSNKFRERLRLRIDILYLRIRSVSLGIYKGCDIKSVPYDVLLEDRVQVRIFFYLDNV